MHRAIPFDTSTAPTNISAKAMYVGLTNIMGRQFFSRNIETLNDSWRNELHFWADRTFTNDAGEVKMKMRIWSNGPNERNESGAGDDIQTEFELRVPAESTQAHKEMRKAE